MTGGEPRNLPPEGGVLVHSNNKSTLQLCRQCLAAERGMAEVRAISAAHGLAVRAFAGQYRPEGRPFLCHVIGVASLPMMLDASTTTIASGLLHSVYTHGDFRRGPGRPIRSGREAVRRADTIEDALDQGLSFSDKTANTNREISVGAVACLAAAVGYPRLVAPLRALLHHEPHSPELTALNGHRRGSHGVGPASWRERMVPRLARLRHRTFLMASAKRLP